MNSQVGVGRHDTGLIDNVPGVPYALCTQTGGNLADLTALLSHELVEACSDTVLGTGVLCDSDQGQNRELCDVCSGPAGAGELVYCGVNVQSYWSQRDQACFIPDPPLSDPVVGTPSLIQGKFGIKGNFELVVPLATGGLVHYWRNNDVDFVPWNGATFFGTNDGAFDAAALIQSSFTEGSNIGNLEAVARQQGQLVHYWRTDQPPLIWIGPFGAEVGLPTEGISGTPSLIESRFGANRRNFELVVPLASGGLAHYWRNNDTTFRWELSAIFGQGRQFDAVTLIQSNFSAGGGIGNLEVVARAGNKLVFFWRDDTMPLAWHGPLELTNL